MARKKKYMPYDSLSFLSIAKRKKLGGIEACERRTKVRKERVSISEAPSLRSEKKVHLMVKYLET